MHINISHPCEKKYVFLPVTGPLGKDVCAWQIIILCVGKLEMNRTEQFCVLQYTGIIKQIFLEMCSTWLIQQPCEPGRFSVW